MSPARCWVYSPALTIKLRAGAGLGVKRAAGHLLSLPEPSQTKDLLVPPLRICLIKVSGFVRSLKNTRKNKLKTQACYFFLNVFGNKANSI